MPLEDENAAFCPHCGKPLTEQTAAEETAAEAAEEKKTEAAPAAEAAAPTAPNCDLAQNSERSYSQRQGSVFSRCPLVMCSYGSEGAGRLTSSNSF